MSALVIKLDTHSSKILADLAKVLGGNVLSIKDAEYEDFALGRLMDKVKTNQTVSRELVMKKLKKNDC